MFKCTHMRDTLMQVQMILSAVKLNIHIFLRNWVCDNHAVSPDSLKNFLLHLLVYACERCSSLVWGSDDNL